MFKTHPIVRILNQNRREIRIGILAIVMVLIIIKVLNGLAEKDVAEKNIVEQEQQLQINIGNEHKNIIENFLNLCIKGDESKAYILLSNKCKINSYQNLENFKENYIKKYFASAKKYSIAYISNNNTEYYYTIKITDDILATGNKKSETITQRFTVVLEDNEEKIIIN